VIEPSPHARPAPAAPTTERCGLTVGVLGDGRLGRAIAARLGQDMTVVRLADCIPPTGLAVPSFIVIAENGASGQDGFASRIGWDMPWLPVRVELGTAIIGPAALPGTAGCPACARLRREKARTDTHQLREARKRFPDRFGTGDIRLTGFVTHVIADLVADEVTRLNSAGSTARTRGGVVHVLLDSLRCTVHRYLPEPGCPSCGALPDDSMDAARITLVPRPKPAPGTYRVRDLRTAAGDLADTYIDAETGLIRGLQRTIFGTYPTTSAPIGVSVDPPQTESGFGRDLNFRSAQLTAIAEAVERYGGMWPGGKHTVVHGSHRQLASMALDPKILGLYPDERYSLPNFPFQGYHEDLAVPWVWGFSFARGEPVLVPECCVYYRMHMADPTYRPFVYEISNGCALGSCVEEAILHGILELAERDAFLLTWYARMPVRPLDLGSACDRTIPLMVDRLQHTSGYTVHAFDTTTEHGIPSVWVMAVRPGDDEAVPKALCAAAAGFDPERAIISALLELAPMVQWRREKYAEDLPRASQMLENPNYVISMNDHALVNAHPRAFSRFDFLFQSQGNGLHPINESFNGSFRPCHDDLTADLTATIGRYLDRGQDVVVVDQTTPEHVAGGFSCVKAIIPGLLPMTFGHWARRVDGLPRLYQVPYLLGYYPEPLRPEDINPHPHPFP